MMKDYIVKGEWVYDKKYPPNSKVTLDENFANKLINEFPDLLEPLELKSPKIVEDKEK